MIGYILDQSWWNGINNIQQSRNAGAIATFIRFGSINSFTGECYDDHIIDENVANAKANGFPFGAYFYMRPKFDGTLQGNYFVNLLNKHNPQLPAVVDVEEPGDYQNIIKMFEVLHTHGYERYLYTSQYAWDYNFPAVSYWKLLHLWAARWTGADMDSPWEDGRAVFRDFPEWKFWQKYANGNGRGVEFGFPPPPYGDADVDLSFYNGTLEEFEEEYKVDGQPLPLPQGGYIVNNSGLYIREKPYVGAKILGTRNSGDIVTPEDYGGSDFWISDIKGWSAVNHGGKQYMQKA